MALFDQFGIQPMLLLAQIVNFLILLWILKKFLYSPILKLLEERKRRIAKSLEDAQKIEERLAKLEKDREKVLAKAALEARKIVEDAGKSASQVIADAHQKAQEDIDLMMTKALAEQRLEKDKMRQELRSELANLIVLGLQKISGKVFTREDQKNLVEQSIRDL